MKVINRERLIELMPKPKNDIETEYYVEILDLIYDLAVFEIDNDDYN